MQKVKSTADESKALYELLKTKPQIDQKLNYFKELLMSQDDLHQALQKRLKKGKVSSWSYLFGFIPIKTNKVLDELEKSRLRQELIHVQDTVFSNQQYYENWVASGKDYDFKMDEITRECNEEWDGLMVKAKEITSNDRLAKEISEYKNEKNDQRIKNEFYLFVKQEVNNNEVHRKRR